MDAIINEVKTYGFDSVRANRGAGLTIPLQIALRNAGRPIEVDGSM